LRFKRLRCGIPCHNGVTRPGEAAYANAGGAQLTDVSGPYTYSSALGAGDCPAGTYHIDLVHGTAAWSDGLYHLHGYERGDVVPTIELILAHKHPDDKPRAQEIVDEICRHGGHFSIYHRIIDARGRLHRVLTSGEGTVDAWGTVTAIDGMMVDLTATLQRETEVAAREAVQRATSTRSVIDQARGLVMGRLRVGSDEAFRLLVRLSSRTNMKLAVVAADLVAIADSPDPKGPDGPDRLDAAVHDLLNGKPKRQRRDARG
jgi:flavin-binding protein dodecin